MKPTESMIEAGARSLWASEYIGLEERAKVGAVLTAAMPLIEAAVAERIADKIEDEKCLDDRWIAHMYYVEGREDSATIARTYPEWSKE